MKTTREKLMSGFHSCVHYICCLRIGKDIFSQGQKILAWYSLHYVSTSKVLGLPEPEILFPSQDSTEPLCFNGSSQNDMYHCYFSLKADQY